MSLRIYLLGQFKLEANNQPLQLPSRPAQSLLAYLALYAGEPQRRERVAGLLWPDANEESARAYLRQALWRLRKAFEAGGIDPQAFLQIDDVSVALADQAPIWLDTAQLLEGGTSSATAETLITAVQLYRGDLLPGFYDEWIPPERERLQAAFQQRMHQLLAVLLAARRWDDLLTWAEQWLRLDPAAEPAYRALLHAYAGLGNQGLLSATYQRCLQALDRELGLEPGPETIHLYEQLLSGAAEPAGGVSAAPQATPPPFLTAGQQPSREPPLFVARAQELAALEIQLNETLPGYSRVLFITGEAGSGKTALLSEFARSAQERHPDLLVAGGNCSAHTGLGDPYLPFREILEQLTGDIEARWAAGAMSTAQAHRLWHASPLVTRTLVETAPHLVDTMLSGNLLAARAVQAAPIGAPWLDRLQAALQQEPTTTLPGQNDLFQQITRLLQTVSRSKPLLLLLDDLQWADLGSISLLFHLGRQLGNHPVLVLGAYRPEEIAIGRDGERHPLDPVVHELQRLSGTATLHLGGEEGRDFLQALLDSQPNRLDAPFREMLYRQTGGHPLFTVELLRGLQERGDLRQDEAGYWVVGQVLDWQTMPARVEAVIAERIGRLPATLRTALRVASVEGDRFTAEVVAAVQETPPRQFLEQLSGELDRRHRLVHAESIERFNGRLLSRYRFRHFLYQKYLYGTLDDVERVYLHEQVGLALEALYQTAERRAAIAPQLARHFEQAHITAKAIAYLHQGGEHALRLSAYQEGITYLTRGLALLEMLPASPQRARQELPIVLDLGIAWQAIVGAQSPKAIAAYNRARHLCRQIGDPLQLCRVLGILSTAYYVRAEYQHALAVAQEAFDLAQEVGEAKLLMLTHWYLGVILPTLGRFAEALDHLDYVIASYEPARHHDYFVLMRGSDAGLGALAYSAFCLWVLGFPDQASRRSRQALALAQELGHPFSSCDVLCFAGCVTNSMRRAAGELQRISRQFMDIARQIELAGWLGTATRYQGEALYLLGHVQEGLGKMERGLASMRDSDIHLHFTGTFGFLAQAQADSGQVEQGLATLDSALDLVEETAEHLWEAELHRLKGDLHLRQGDLAAAETSLHKAITVAQNQGARSWELRAANSLARLWLAQGKPAEAQALLAPIYAWFTEGFDTQDLQEAQDLLAQVAGEAVRE